MKEKEIYMNNMVTLDKLTPSKAILVFKGEEPRGIVCKDKFVGEARQFYRIQWANGYTSDLLSLPVLVSSYHGDGFTFKTQLESGEPLQEIIAIGNWVHIDDIKSTDLVLVKKSGNIIGMVGWIPDGYYIANAISGVVQGGYFSIKYCVEKGQEQGYSFFLQVNDTP